MSFMIITTSAKRMDESPDWSAVVTSQARYCDITRGLVDYLKNLPVKKLGSVMQISENLANINAERLQKWTAKHSAKNSKPAILTYSGDVYQQFDAKSFDNKQQNYAQKYLRISSGLYGLIRAYDLIQPYRLEMRLKLSYTKNRTMNEYWREEATKALNADIKTTKATFVLNCASKEYAKVVDQKKLSVPLITAEFQENKGGTLKTIPLYSKQARGMLVGFCIENQITDVEGLKKFSTAGYKYAESDSDRILYVRAQRNLEPIILDHYTFFPRF